MGKGQNVENHFVESQKKNIESLKFEKDQNVKSIFRTSKVFSERRKSNLSDFQIVNYLWRKYLWRFGVKYQS